MRWSRGTRAFGEAEYWLAYVKVILIILFIIVGLIYDWGGVIGHPGPGLSNFNTDTFMSGFAGTGTSIQTVLELDLELG